MRIRKQFVIPPNDQADPVFEEARKFATSGIFETGAAITLSVEAEADGVSRARAPVNKSATLAKPRPRRSPKLPMPAEIAPHGGFGADPT